MSRNKREGRYAGALNSRHYRTRGANCTVGRIDVCIELEMRRIGDAAGMFNRLMDDIGWPMRAPKSGFAFDYEEQHHG